MIDARNPNYSETILQMEELKTILLKIERNALFQLPQDLTNKLFASKDNFMNWIDEAEFTLRNYA